MKIKRVRKQGKVQSRQRVKSGRSDMSIIDRRSLSIKSRKGGVWPPCREKVAVVKKLKKK